MMVAPKRSKMAALGWWMVQRTVLPSSARTLTASMTSSAIAESSPEVGSSKNRHCGSLIRQTAMETLLSSPPLTPLLSGPPILVFMALKRPIFSMTSRALDLLSTYDMIAGSLSIAVKTMHSYTVKEDSSASCCCTYAVSLFRRKLVGSLPSKRTFPEISPVVFLPLMTSSKLVLPAPLGPSRAYICPGQITPVMFFRIALLGFLF
mmetsp:Transcript_2661/g.9810  ORF Transcript_2661/g.9810 Transcript_2661/m.9810 type:complete len:206 (+) Transcript_2661:1584-2201(+)